MASSHKAKDVAGQLVQVGDVVTDSRGHLFRVKETPGTVLANRVMYAQGVSWSRHALRDIGGPTAVRLYVSLRIDPSPDARQNYAEAYHAAYELHGRAVTEADLASHKRRVKAAGLAGGR